MMTPQAKRRRLNEATKTLQKPFKSPFRTSPNPNLSSDPPSIPPSINVTPGLTSCPPQITPTSSKPRLAKGANSLLLRPTSSIPTHSTLKIQSPRPNLPREIMQLRNDIQVLLQARSLATSTKDEDLRTLIDRWRTASRAAAEELFASTRDRVNSMGGVGAWKDREKEQNEWRQKSNREELNAERERMQQTKQSGDVGEDTYEEYTEAYLPEDDKEEEEEAFQSADDDSFTMDMMLKTLNIDLKLIGYNKETQRWDG